MSVIYMFECERTCRGILSGGTRGLVKYLSGEEADKGCHLLLCTVAETNESYNPDYIIVSN